MVSLILIHWIVIYPVDSAIQLLNNWGLDNGQILGLVSMDLKKLSTIYLPHELTGRNLENMLLTTKPEY